MFANRERGRPVRNLEWRIRLFGVGAILAVAGIFSGQRWMINAAIVVLLLGFALRFAGPRGPVEPEESGRD